MTTSDLNQNLGAIVDLSVNIIKHSALACRSGHHQIRQAIPECLKGPPVSAEHQQTKLSNLKPALKALAAERSSTLPE